MSRLKCAENLMTLIFPEERTPDAELNTHSKRVNHVEWESISRPNRIQAFTSDDNIHEKYESTLKLLSRLIEIYYDLLRVGCVGAGWDGTQQKQRLSILRYKRI